MTVDVKLIKDICRRYSVLILMPIITIICGCEVELAKGLSDDVSLRLLTDLAEGGIVATRYSESQGKAHSWSVHVDNSVRHAALSILTKLKPIARRDIQGGANDPLLGDAESHRDGRVEKLALSLEQSLERLPRVREVLVHLSIRQPKSFSASDVSTHVSESDSAAVLITTYPRAEIEPDKISRLVSGATGISLASIAVVINELPSELFSPSDSKEIQVTNELSLEKNSQSNVFPEARILLASLGVVCTLTVVAYRLVRISKPIKLIVDEKC